MIPSAQWQSNQTSKRLGHGFELCKKHSDFSVSPYLCDYTRGTRKITKKRIKKMKELLLPTNQGRQQHLSFPKMRKTVISIVIASSEGIPNSLLSCLFFVLLLRS